MSDNYGFFLNGHSPSNASVNLALEDVRKSNLSPETLERSLVKIFNEGHEILGSRLGRVSLNGQNLLQAFLLVEFPYFGEDRNIALYRYKLIPPTIDKDGREVKYLHPLNIPAVPYIHPDVWKEKDKTHKPIWFSEGEKKALILLQLGRLAIAPGGVWNFRAGQDSQEEGSKYLWQEILRFSFSGRTCFLGFDADLWVNPQVRYALYELAFKLIAKEAIVKIPTWASSKGKGIDDYLKTCEDMGKALTELEEKATPLQEFISFDHHREIIRAFAQASPEMSPLTGTHLVKVLAKLFKVREKDLLAEIAKYEPPPTISENIIIAHPSYEVNQEFLSIGFRETIVEDNQPRDRNIYVISTKDGIKLHEKRLFQLGDRRVLFDERDRLLLPVNDKWNKDKIVRFISQPVSPEGVYREIKDTIKQYIEYQNNAIYGLIASWIIATYFFRIFNAFPFLFFYGKKQSGKSRSLDLLERLAFNAMKVKGISIAAFADSVDGVKGTFLNDQAEALSSERNAELLGHLADSYTPGGGKRRVVDISNKSRKVIEFETYAPKAFASTKEIDPDLKDRCVEIVMIRAERDYPYPESFLPIWHDLRDKLYRLLLTKWREVREIYQDSGKGMIHRIKELWRPMETMLRLENVPEEEQKVIKDFFLESMILTQSELTDKEEEVFKALLEMLAQTEENIFTVSEIAVKLKHDENTNELGLQIFVGKVLSQLSLYDRHAGRKERKRAYKFSHDRVKNIYERYSVPSNGFNGYMVIDQQSQGPADDHRKNSNGIQWSNNGCAGNPDGQKTNEIPFATIEKKPMVNGEALKNLAPDHMTKETIGFTEGKNNFDVGVIYLDDEDIEVIE